MDGFALRLAMLRGWRRTSAAALAGAVAALAAPPVYLIVALFAGLSALAWLLDGVHAQSDSPMRRAPRAFLTGWAFGFGYFAPNLYWIGEAFLVEAELFSWMIPFVVVLLPLGLGAFHGLAAMFASAIVWPSGIARAALLACGFTAVEWIRGHAFTGFPWAVLGYSAGALEGLEQLAAYCGVYGLTFLVVFACSAPATLVGGGDEAVRGSVGRVAGVVAVFAVAAVLWSAGAARLAGAQTRFEDDVRLRLVQPNIPQDRKWDPEYRDEIFDALIGLSNAASDSEAADAKGAKDASHVIWPESAIPFLLSENPEAQMRIAEMLPRNATLITGALRRSRPGKSGEANDGRARNSVLVIDHEGKVVASYDKARLVPFGEYLPLASFLEPLGLRRLVVLPGSFAAGPGPKSIALETAPPVSLLVCYEIIFPRAVTDAGRRPGWLLNVTNDAWFGDSIGPRQHFAQSRMRAIEEGLPVVRVANTGISAVVDSHGRVLRSLPLGRRGVLDGRLPGAAPETFYARFGDRVVFMIVLFGLCAAAFPRFLSRVRPAGRRSGI